MFPKWHINPTFWFNVPIQTPYAERRLRFRRSRSARNGEMLKVRAGGEISDSALEVA